MSGSKAVQSLCVVGSTGLIGKQFLASIPEGSFSQITALSRRNIPDLENRTYIRQSIHDFKTLETMRSDLKTDVLVCTLGTTIKTAGSQQRFVEIDHDLPLALAKMSLDAGCRKMILVSSVGAAAGSKIFYSRVKGMLETALSDLSFEELHILRPSMLLGDREEKRAGEKLGKLIMQPLGFLIPWKYKPIHAKTLAATILHLCEVTNQGIHIHEGKSLFFPE